MLKKFEIACLIGTNEIIYKRIRTDEDNEKDEAQFDDRIDDPPKFDHRILKLVSDK